MAPQDEAFLSAASAGNLSLMNRFLFPDDPKRRAAKRECVDERGCSALTLATRTGRQDAVSLILRTWSSIQELLPLERGRSHSTIFTQTIYFGFCYARIGSVAARRWVLDRFARQRWIYCTRACCAQWPLRLRRHAGGSRCRA